MISLGSDSLVVIAGGSGFLGRGLARHLAAEGFRVTLISRNCPSETGPWSFKSWDARSLGDWAEGSEVRIADGHRLRIRRSLPKRAARTLVVVVEPLPLEQHPGLLQCEEDLAVQQLVSELAVEVRYSRSPKGSPAG